MHRRDVVMAGSERGSFSESCSQHSQSTLVTFVDVNICQLTSLHFFHSCVKRWRSTALGVLQVVLNFRALSFCGHMRPVALEMSLFYAVPARSQHYIEAEACSWTAKSADYRALQELVPNSAMAAMGPSSG